MVALEEATSKKKMDSSIKWRCEIEGACLAILMPFKKLSFLAFQSAWTRLQWRVGGGKGKKTSLCLKPWNGEKE